MAMLEPKLGPIYWMKTDSGLDLIALRIVGHGVNKLKSKGQRKSIVITHYQNVYWKNYISSGFVLFMYCTTEKGSLNLGNPKDLGFLGNWKKKKGTIGLKTGKKTCYLKN